MGEMCLEGQWLMHLVLYTWKEKKHNIVHQKKEMWSSQLKNPFKSNAKPSKKHRPGQPSQPGSASANCECWPWNQTHAPRRDNTVWVLKRFVGHREQWVDKSAVSAALLYFMGFDWLCHAWNKLHSVTWLVARWRIGYWIVSSCVWENRTLHFVHVFFCSWQPFLEIQSWNWIVLLVSAVHFRSSPLEKSWKNFKP